MSSYLEAYGAAEEKHAKQIKLIKISVVVLACVLVVGLILYGLFKNYTEEQKAKTFIELLQKRDYQAAYRLWGCTETQPCPNYKFEKFMEDWGSQSGHADASSAHIGMSQSCGTGVILRVDFKNAEPLPLWVERDTKVISFAPWPECPGRHLHLGTWLRSLFGH